MFSPNLSKIARFCFIEIKIFLGEDPQTPHFLLSKRPMVTQYFLVQKTPPPPTHTHTRTDPPFASEKNRTRRKNKENIMPPKHTSYTLYAIFFFFFLLFDVRPLLLKISGSAHVMHHHHIQVLANKHCNKPKVQHQTKETFETPPVYNDLVRWTSIPRKNRNVMLMH